MAEVSDQSLDEEIRCLSEGIVHSGIIMEEEDSRTSGCSEPPVVDRGDVLNTERGPCLDAGVNRGIRGDSILMDSCPYRRIHLVRFSLQAFCLITVTKRDETSRR